jgi:hypothetical protein
LRGKGAAPEREGNGQPSPSASAAPFPRAVLAAILLGAAYLRFSGLAWGLPNAHHWFSYHPDEALILLAAAKVNVFAGQLDPGFFNYGSLYIYLISAVTHVLDAWAPLSQPWQELARMTLVGRALAASFGVGTVYATYLIANRLAGRRAGFIAAIIMAVLPMHVVHSHFATVDVPATFWVSAALYNALRWPAGRRAALWCGIFAGLAAGTKYNAGLVLLASWAAAAMAREVPKSARWQAAGLITAACAAAFLLSTPGVAINTPQFLHDFGYEAQHVRTGHGLVFVNTGPGWLYHLRVNLWQGIGPFLPIAALIALRHIRRPVRLHPATITLLAFGLPYFALIAAAAVRFQRYDMPLLPLLAAGAAVLMDRERGRWMHVSTAAIIATMVLATGLKNTMAAPAGDLQMTGQPYRGDPRDAVAEWFRQTVPPGRTVGLASAPWFYTPPFTTANAGPQSRGAFGHEATPPAYPLLLPDAEGETAWSQWPDLIVISDYEYGDAMRLQGAPVVERAAQIDRVKIDPSSPEEAQRIVRLWNNVVARYELVGLWSPRMPAMGLSWPKKALPPHDAFYPYPTLIVFRRSDKK